jgi:large subunit ribosomal protein L18
MAVSFSGKNIYVQFVDDLAGKTLAAVSTVEKEFGGKAKVNHSNVAAAKKLGGMAAQRALAKKIKAVVFDRGGFQYHGRVVALADAAREAGLQF